MLRAQHAPFLAGSAGLIGNPWRQNYSADGDPPAGAKPMLRYAVWDNMQG